MPDGVKLIEYRVTPVQAAWFEYLKLHPYIIFDKLKVHEGIPLEAQITTELGVETVRFDKIAKDLGLI